MKDKKIIIYEMPSVELGENEKILKEYKTIIKKKLKRPIDLKKLYYEQFEDKKVSRKRETFFGDNIREAIKIIRG